MYVYIQGDWEEGRRKSNENVLDVGPGEAMIEIVGLGWK